MYDFYVTTLCSLVYYKDPHFSLANQTTILCGGFSTSHKRKGNLAFETTKNFTEVRKINVHQIYTYMRTTEAYLSISYLLLRSVCLVARYVLGHDAMRKMGKSNVLVSGMKGLGVEIGKGTQLCLLLRQNNKKSFHRMFLCIP